MEPEMLEEMLAEEERDADGKVKINAAFYGMEEYPLSQLNVFEGDIADLYDSEKNAIAAVYTGDDYGAAIEGSQWAKVGDTVKVRYVYEWEYLDVKTGEVIPEDQVDVYEGEIVAKEKEYQDARDTYGNKFRVGMGAEAIKELPWATAFTEIISLF
jgi:putative ABC transport system permease protein